MSSAVASSARIYKRQLLALEIVSSAITGVVDLDHVLEIIVNQLVHELGYVMPSIYLYNENSQKLLVRKVNVPGSVVKIAESSVGLNLSEIGFSISDQSNILVRTFLTSEPQVTHHFEEFVTPLITGLVARSMQALLHLNSMVAIPIRAQKEIMGVLALGTRRDEVSEGELKVLRTFANQISIAIYNARLYQKSAEQLEALNEQKRDLESLLGITESAIRSLNPQKVGQTIVNAIPDRLGHLGFVAGIILRYVPQSEMVHVLSITESEAMGPVFRLLRKPITEFEASIRGKYTIVPRAIESGEIQLSDDLSDFAGDQLPQKIVNKMQKLLNIGGIVVVPLRVRGRIIGVFALFSTKNVNTITKRERDMSEAFANNIAGALENARLHNEVEAKIEELQEKNAYLRALDETKSNFLSIASHQLRTPISGIRGYLDMLNNGDFGPLSEKQAEVIAMNLDNANRMVKVINMFLNISRIEAGRLKLDRVETSVMEMISTVVKELENQIVKKGLTIEIRTPKRALPPVHIDADKMRQVILNLIDNSAKYTEEGGITVIPTYNAQLDAIEIEVQDTGIGIKKEDVARLFGKFVRIEGGARANANGSGLGLYIIKKITEAHGGEVWVTSGGPGKGSSFFIRFPVAPSEEQLEKEAREQVEFSGQEHASTAPQEEEEGGLSGSALAGVG